MDQCVNFTMIFKKGTAFCFLYEPFSVIISEKTKHHYSVFRIFLCFIHWFSLFSKFEVRAYTLIRSGARAAMCCALLCCAEMGCAVKILSTESKGLN
jgi:hypothetical protein